MEDEQMRALGEGRRGSQVAVMQLLEVESRRKQAQTKHDFVEVVLERTQKQLPSLIMLASRREANSERFQQGLLSFRMSLQWTLQCTIEVVSITSPEMFTKEHWTVNDNTPISSGNHADSTSGTVLMHFVEYKCRQHIRMKLSFMAHPVGIYSDRVSHEAQTGLGAQNHANLNGQLLGVEGA